MGAFDDLIPIQPPTKSSGLFDDLIPQRNPWDQFPRVKQESGAGASEWDRFPRAPSSTSSLDMAVPQAKPREATPAPTEKQSWAGWVKSLVTGEGRTEFPDAPEFQQPGNMTIEEARSGKARFAGDPRSVEDLIADRPAVADPTALNKSAITSDPAAQLDILRKQMPGIEDKQDKFGNVMVRMPGQDWAYLNKPGASWRDLDEVATQTLATLPFLGAAGKGATVAERIASGVGMGGVASMANDALATAAGSEQGIDPVKAGVAAGITGTTAPGVPTAIATGVRDAVKTVTDPVTRSVRATVAPQNEAGRRVAAAYETDLAARRARTDANAMTPEGRSDNEAMARVLNDGRAGDDLRVMDLGGEETRKLARSAANVSAPAREILNDAVNDRFEGQAGRAVEFLKSISGGKWSADATREDLKQQARKVRAPLYKAAYQSGEGGIWSSELERLAGSPVVLQAMKDASTRGKDRAIAEGFGAFNPGVEFGEGGLLKFTTGKKGVPTYPNLQFWDYTKRELDDAAKMAFRQGQNDLGSTYRTLAGQLRDELDTLIPNYRNARGAASSFFGANDALEAGEAFVTGRFQNEAARKALEKMSEGERELFRHGFISRFIQTIDEIGDRRNILNSIAQSPAARERMSIALGETKARELEAFLRIEKLMDLPRGAIQGNSTTVRQALEIGAAAAIGGGAGSWDPSNPTSWFAALLTGYAAKRGRMKLDDRIATKIAEMLVSKDEAVFAKGVKQIAHTPLLNVVRAIDEALEGAGLARNIGAQQLANGRN